VVISIWAGGLVALGAIAAPTVFGIVPAPTSADAMTAVFIRFDRVAMACAAITLVAEALHLASAVGGHRGSPVARLSSSDVVRLGTAVLASALAVGEGAWLSPSIAELHRGGAIRGLGEAGLALERTHRLAEAAGKGQLALLFLTLLLTVWRVRGAPLSGAGPSQSGDGDDSAA
jgi:hypothetical protein